MRRIVQYEVLSIPRACSLSTSGLVADLGFFLFGFGMAAHSARQPPAALISMMIGKPLLTGRHRLSYRTPRASALGGMMAGEHFAGE